LNGVYAALPWLKKTPNSLLFTTSSSSATYGMPRIAVYAATKHAVKGLTEALSIEFARHGVRVADVLPGLIDTAILRPRPTARGAADGIEFTPRAEDRHVGLMPADSAKARHAITRQAALLRARRSRLARPDWVCAQLHPRPDQEIHRGAGAPARIRKGRGYSPPETFHIQQYVILTAQR
jgi:NAD(P)-dependent dehydrogenase (short-subunit alcohol dehydrogenase family)